MTTRRRGRSAEEKLMTLYNQRARKWGESYLARHRWRIAAMYDMDDIRQDAFAVYLRVYRRHPKLGEADLFRIFQRGIRGRLDNRSRQCFPNSYAYMEGQGRVVVELHEEYLESCSANEPEVYLDWLSNVVTQLPDELADVVKLLILDFIGVACIEQCKAKKLSGKQRTEPLNKAIARLMKLDPTRDVLNELDLALGRDIHQKRS